MQKKLETCRNLNLIGSRRPSFGDQVNVTFISKQPVPWILNNFIYFTYFIQGNDYIYLKEFYIWHRHLTVQVKNSHALASLCVLCFTGNNA